MPNKRSGGREPARGPTGEPARAGGGCCGVEAVVAVDARGQLVLPKDLRERAGIAAGDRLAVVSLRRSGRVCCLSLMKVEELAGTVRDILGPVMRELSMEGGDDA